MSQSVVISKKKVKVLLSKITSLESTLKTLRLKVKDGFKSEREKKNHWKVMQIIQDELLIRKEIMEYLLGGSYDL